MNTNALKRLWLVKGIKIYRHFCGGRHFEAVLVSTEARQQSVYIKLFDGGNKTYVKFTMGVS